MERSGLVCVSAHGMTESHRERVLMTRYKKNPLDNRLLTKEMIKIEVRLKTRLV
jgi:hypothetical protein